MGYIVVEKEKRTGKERIILDDLGWENSLGTAESAKKLREMVLRDQGKLDDYDIYIRKSEEIKERI